MSVLASDDAPDARPSLIADWQDGSSHDDSLRMLSGLESTRDKSGRRLGKARSVAKSGRSHEAQGPQHAVPWRMSAALALTALVLGTVYAWFVMHQAGTPPSFLPKVHPASAALVSKRMGTAPSAATIETVNAEGNPFSQLDVPVAAVAASAAPAPFSSLGGVAADTIKQGHGSPQAAAAASDGLPSSLPQLVKTVVTRATDLPPVQRDTSEPESDKGALEAQKAVPWQAGKPSTMSAAQRRQAAREADAALLSALVSHVSAHLRGEVNGVMPPLRLAGGKTPPMTTIAEIVGHCRTLQGEEAKQCRVKICENYWGKDDACSTRPSFHRSETH